MGARILSDKLIARVSILRFVCSFLAAAAIVPPAFAGSAGAAAARLPSPRGRSRGAQSKSASSAEARSLSQPSTRRATISSRWHPSQSAGSWRAGRGRELRASRRRHAVRPCPPTGSGAWMVGGAAFPPLELSGHRDGAHVFSEGSGSLLFTNDPVSHDDF